MESAREEALRLIERLAPRGQCVLGYDRSLAEQMPEILWEMHGIAPEAAELPAEAVRLFDLLDSSKRLPRHASQLPALLAMDPEISSRLRTHGDAARVARVASQFDHWTEQRAEDDRESVITLQKDLGRGQYNSSMKEYSADRGVRRLRDYLGSVTTAPRSLAERLARRSFWELKIGLWRLFGRVDTSLPSLSVGPRWVTEIHFFRDVLGFRRHIGLDLFTDDPTLVTTGDMHQMPFPDAHFGLVFLKNVVDKSYDIRKLVSELIRVAAPGGVVIVDQICGYGYCTPITRTDIQSARNLKRLFERRARIETLACSDIDISGIGDAKETGERRYNARLAIKILK
jgi:SAM-dependent methyltransferase